MLVKRRFELGFDLLKFLKALICQGLSVNRHVAIHSNAYFNNRESLNIKFKILSFMFMFLCWSYVNVN